MTILFATFFAFRQLPGWKMTGAVCEMAFTSKWYSCFTGVLRPNCFDESV